MMDHCMASLFRVGMLYCAFLRPYTDKDTGVGREHSVRLIPDTRVFTSFFMQGCGLRYAESTILADGPVHDPVKGHGQGPRHNSNKFVSVVRSR